MGRRGHLGHSGDVVAAIVFPEDEQANGLSGLA